MFFYYSLHWLVFIQYLMHFALKNQGHRISVILFQIVCLTVIPLVFKNNFLIGPTEQMMTSCVDLNLAQKNVSHFKEVKNEDYLSNILRHHDFLLGIS